MMGGHGAPDGGHAAGGPDVAEMERKASQKVDLGHFRAALEAALNGSSKQVA